MHPGTISFNFCFCRCNKKRNQIIHQLQTIEEEQKAIEARLEATKNCNEKLQELIGFKKVETSFYLFMAQLAIFINNHGAGYAMFSKFYDILTLMMCP